jgi:hypothetical protein
MTYSASTNISSKKIIFLSFIIELVGLIIFIISSVGGHGTYFFTRILFPYLMISTAIFDTMTGHFILISLFQYPFYGLLLVYAYRKNCYRKMFRILVTFHAVFIFISFIVSSEYFPN